jgi:hypothetical protein
MTEEPTDNAADPQAIRAKGRKSKRDDEQRDEDLRELLALPSGRRFLRRLIFIECALNQTSYHPSGQTFAFNEGRRGVAAQLQGEIMSANLEGWFQLIREDLVKP